MSNMHIKRNVNFFIINMRNVPISKKQIFICLKCLFEINSCKGHDFCDNETLQTNISFYTYKNHRDIYKKIYSRKNWIKHFIYPTNNAFFHISILYHYMKILAFQNNLFNKKK